MTGFFNVCLFLAPTKFVTIRVENSLGSYTNLTFIQRFFLVVLTGIFSASCGTSPTPPTSGTIDDTCLSLYNNKALKQAVTTCTENAINGNADAQFALGMMYYKGTGVPQDFKKALEWYFKSAAQGFALAQHNLGSIYATGTATTQDYVKAVKWYRKAAEQGFPTSQNNLCVMYATGRGITRNHVEAYAWCHIAASQGDSTARKNRNHIASIIDPAQRKEAKLLAAEYEKNYTRPQIKN